MLKNVIFDFDGVIHNTFDFHLRALQEHRPEYGMNAQEYRDMHNGNFYEHKSEKAPYDFSGYDDHIRTKQSSLCIEHAVFSGLVALAEHVRLFIVSSGSRKGVGDYLQKNNIARLFTATYFKEDSLYKKEKFTMLFAQYNASAQDSVFITDTVGDIYAAHEVSLPTVGVTFGFHDRMQLKKGNPDSLVDSWEELVALLLDSGIMSSLLSK